jgi:D-Tyr-tRNAtyr deacylase
LRTDTTRQKGTRPDLSLAAPRGEAEPLYEVFCEALRALGVRVQTGVFGERMALELVNDGPVTKLRRRPWGADATTPWQLAFELAPTQ